MEVSFSNPIYNIGPSLPQECQEPWAALIDTGAVASTTPQSLVPHTPTMTKEKERRPHQSQWWEHQGLRYQECQLHHWQSHHSCELPHCRRRQEFNHRSRCHSSQSPSSSSSWKMKVHTSSASAQSTSSLSSKSFITTNQVWFFQIMFKVIIFDGQSLSSQLWTVSQHPTSLRSSMTISLQLQDRSC